MIQKLDYFMNNTGTLPYHLTAIIIVISIIFTKLDAFKEYDKYELSVEASCKNSIVSYLNKDIYSYDSLKYLKKKNLNNSQDNEIGVQFKTMPTNKIITSIYYRDKKQCVVVNTNSGFIY